MIVVVAAPAALWAQSAPQPTTRPAIDRDRQQLEIASDKARQDVMNDQLGIEENTEVLRSATGRTDVTPAILHQAMAAMDDQIESLQLQQVSQQARAEAITEAVKQAANLAAKKTDVDPAVLELTKVADGRERNLDMLKSGHVNGTISDKEVTDAESDVAEARAQVDLRRESVYAANGGDVVAALNKELIDLEIASSDCKAKLEFLKNQANETLHVTDNIDRLESLQKKLAMDEADAQGLRERLEDEQLSIPTANPATSAPSP
jgi:hypothetical protein